MIIRRSLPHIRNNVPVQTNGCRATGMATAQRSPAESLLRQARELDPDDGGTATLPAALLLWQLREMRACDSYDGDWVDEVGDEEEEEPEEIWATAIQARHNEAVRLLEHVLRADPTNASAAVGLLAVREADWTCRRPAVVLADRGYDHDKNRRLIRELQIRPLIARRGTAHGSGLAKHRYVAERTLALLSLIAPSFRRHRGSSACGAERSPGRGTGWQSPAAFVHLGFHLLCADRQLWQSQPFDHYRLQRQHADHPRPASNITSAPIDRFMKAVRGASKACWAASFAVVGFGGVFVQAVVIVVVAVFFLGMGLFGLAAPAALIRPFRIIADSSEARNEVRAVYGGFGVAVSALLLVALADAAGMRTGVVITVAVSLLGMALGRLVGRAIEQPAAFYPVWCYFWVEVTVGGALLASVI
ncbi:DUF4345 family protein [Nonomuraea bangladeshensis]|uniref:DUF4345 family protein n=1 Tax=Nonomuraea bangladeshensis TaxID=404385 RepID=UPI003C2C099A